MSRQRFEWNEEKEKLVLKLKEEDGLTYKEIAKILGHTPSSIKHKYIRLKKSQNLEEYHHPQEKINQIEKFLQNKEGLRILETHAGFGNLSKVYNKKATYHLLLEKRADRVEHLEKLGFKNATIIKCDSEKEIHRLVYEKLKFDVIDVDPYGYPSRLFPHVLELIDDGILVITIPKLGVQHLNKLVIEHLRVFWGYNKELDYLEAVKSKLKDFGIQTKRAVKIVDVLDLGRLYRIVIFVKRASSFDLVGLKVKGINA